MRDSLRIFLAIHLPEKVRDVLARMQRDLAAYNLKVRWVRPGNIHLTLVFLGDTPRRLIGPIGEALARAAVQPVFRLAVKGLGVFPSYKRPRVLWAGVAGDTAPLAALKKALDRSLAEVTDLNFTPERRRFKAHLTLGRAKGRIAPSVLAEVSRRWDTSAAPEFTVDSIHLVQSRLRPEGAVYSVLHSVELT